MGENFVYRYGDNLYVNLTNKCCNDCTFCIRNNGDGIGDSGDLWLSREPSAQEVIDGIKKHGEFNELVFCGYGEPTYKVAEMVEVAAFAHSLGKKTRLNTNGLGNLINKRDIVPDLTGAIDEVSVSLNNDNAEDYDSVCRSAYGLYAFSAMLEFAAACVKAGIDTVMSVVAVDGVNIDKCRSVAEKVGAKLRVREYIK